MWTKFLQERKVDAHKKRWKSMTWEGGRTGALLLRTIGGTTS